MVFAGRLARSGRSSLSFVRKRAREGQAPGKTPVVSLLLTPFFNGGSIALL
jgi:hypothetical protein